MAICGCGLPACCCQPAVAGGVIYADLRGELNTHLALQVLFTQSSPVREPLLQTFPFPSTLGEVTLHLLSLACMFVYSSRGKGVCPPSPVEFSSYRCFYKLSCSWLLGGAAAPAGWHFCLQLTLEVSLPPSPVKFSSLCHSHKLSRSWLLGMCPSFRQNLSSQALLVYLQFREGFPSPILWPSVCPTLFSMCLYCSYCLLLSFSFFHGWGSVCPGGYAVLAQDCLWEYHVPLSSPCPSLPKPSGRGHLVACEPS
jgi:hypothetical protein